MKEGLASLGHRLAMEWVVQAGSPQRDVYAGVDDRGALAGDGVRVEHAKDIVPAIEQAIASPKPFIIDAIVSPGELTMPPHIEISEAWGFGMSKVKEGLMGLAGDHEVWKQWRDEFRANVIL